MSAVNVLGIAGSLIILVSLFEMLRRHRLREKYALIWFVIALCALVVALFPAVLLRADHGPRPPGAGQPAVLHRVAWCC